MFFQAIEKFTTTDPLTTNPSPTPSNRNPSTTPANTNPPPILSDSLEPTTTDGSTTTTSSSAILQQCAPPPLPSLAILSRYFGVGFNITYVNYNNTDTYLINHIPTIANGTLGGCYAVTQDSLLTIKLKNSFDNTQLWTMTQFNDKLGLYFIIIPVSNTKFALQYENGNLALRPYNPDLVFEGQKWLTSPYKITRGIPVLNYSPASLFTSEFDPYSSPSTNTNNLTDSNTQQINDVINAVKTGIQKYIGQLDNKQQTDQVSSSSLGQKDQPLNINFSINSDSESESDTSKLSKPGSQKSAFANVNNPSTTDDFLSVMDKYGPSSSSGSSSSLQLYRKSDLDNEIANSQGCPVINMKDYTGNRVGTCNCKL